MYGILLNTWLLAQTAVESADSGSVNPGSTRTWWEFAKSATALVWDWVAVWNWELDLPTRLACATLFGGVGLWLMLPGAAKSRKVTGAIGSLIAAIMIFRELPMSADGLQAVVFWTLAAIVLASAVATITSRSPVYCAVWFALLLLATGGLFLINGAQFLGVATVAVYAGAIVVTFLFVLMLAQPEGHSYYDRISWGKFPSMLGCFAGVGLIAVLVGVIAQTPLAELGPAADQTNLLLDQHVARLGGQLFSRHLVAVQFAGTLLLAALVGAVAMSVHGAKNPDRTQLVASGEHSAANQERPEGLH